MQQAQLPFVDLRHVDHGLPIGQHGYADQPNLVKTNDGAWLCVMTVGAGEEGQAGQHIISTRSFDQGKTWSAPVQIEPPTGPEASWAVACNTPSGRVFVFYVYNTDNLRTIPGDKDTYPKGFTTRVDSLGYYVYRWSDDHGQSWSTQRATIPVRETSIDRTNSTAGKTRLFWNVSSPQLIQNHQSLIVPLHKVAGFGRGFFTRSEGWFVRSDDLLQLDDPSQATWQTLPEGDVGLKSPDGPIAEEQCLAVLSDGSLYCTYRTIDGYACHAYSRDQGHTWTPSAFMVDRQGGRKIKHPRAANFVWQVEPGLYLYWYHNHGVRCHDEGWPPYANRNPVWIRFGREVSGNDGCMLQWSEPEVLLYDDQYEEHRFSYPYLLVENGQWFVSETQKSVGRIHAIPECLQQAGRAWAGLVQPLEANKLIKEAVLSLDHGNRFDEIHMPSLPSFWIDQQDQRAGITLLLQVQNNQPCMLLDNRDTQGKGIALSITSEQTALLYISDGSHQSQWESDSLSADKPINLGVVIDGGPKMISFVVNGQVHDGGTHRQFGWGRFDKATTDLNSKHALVVDLTVKRLQVFARVLLSSELAVLESEQT